MVKSNYNKVYLKYKAFFGKKPSPLIYNHYNLFPRDFSFFDLGCGQGGDLIFMNKMGHRCLGLDNSCIAIEQLRDTIKRNNLRKIKVKQAEILNYDFSNKKYGIINLRNVLQYLKKPESLKIIKKTQGCVRKDGFIIISALTTEDPSYSAKTKGFKSYFKKNELLRIFILKFQILYYYEGLIQDRSHGDYPPHQHGMVMLIARKK